MNRYLRCGLMNQIEMQCRFVIMAYEQLKIASPVVEKFYAIHTLLTAAANVSKAAWGMGGTKSKYYSERDPLRQALSLTDDSPLYPLLDVRNGYEHYDQRLTDVIAENPRPFIVDSNVGPPDAVKMPNKIQLRHFDDTTSDVHFLGYKLNLNDLVVEVQRILPFAKTEAAKL